MNRTVRDFPRLGGRSVTHAGRGSQFGALLLSGVLVTFLSIALVAQPAWAGEGDSPPATYVIVQQAMSYLVNDSSSVGTENALMKVDEALAAESTDGVDVAEVRQARSALLAGNTDTGLQLLHDSIRGAVSKLDPAVGEETGTGFMVAPYVHEGALNGTNWVFLLLSAFVALVGGLLAARLRPREGLRDLSRDILRVKGIRHARTEHAANGGGDNAV